MLSASAMAVGVVASVALWVTESGYRPSSCSASSRRRASSCSTAPPRTALRVLTFAVPALVLIDVSDVFFSPTLGIVVQGALIGSLTALFAVGIALVYRANRIVNFAQGDLGAVPAIFAILLHRQGRAGRRAGLDDRAPLPGRPRHRLDLGAMFLGFVVERTFINRFSRSPRLVLTVATIGIAQLLTALALFMPSWFGFKSRRPRRC